MCSIFHCSRLTAVEDIQGYASLVLAHIALHNYSVV